MSDAQDARALAATAAVARFREAANGGDAAAAEAACTAAGWGQGADSVAGLVRQVTRKRLVLDPIGDVPVLFGDRGSAWTAIARQGGQKPLGDLFILIEKLDGDWKIAGVTKLRPHVGLFLRGALPARVDVRDLPESEAAEAWAEPVLAGLQGEADAALASGVVHDVPAATDDTTVTQLPTVALAAVDRAAAGFRFVTEDTPWGRDSWTILDTSTSPPTVVTARSGLSLEGLLTGIDAPWPKEDPEAPGVEVASTATDADTAQADAIMASAIHRELDKAGVDIQGDTPEANIARMLLAFVEHAPTPKQAGEAAKHVALPPGLEDALSQSVQRLVDDGAVTPGGVKVDGQFIEQHGARLVGGMFAALMGQVLPEQMDITVPVDNPEPDGPQVVTLKAEPQVLLRQLVSGGGEE